MTATPRDRRRLRVVRVYLHLDVGGIETRLVDLLPRLDRERFDVQFVCIRRPGVLAPTLEERGIPVHHIHHHNRLPFALSARRLANGLRRLQPDIVHAHHTVPMLVGTAAASRAEVPVILGNCHIVGAFSRPGEIRREQHLSTLRDTTIHVSQAVYEDYLATVEPEKRDGVVIHNGVDVEGFARPPESARRAALVEELELEGRGPVLIHVGRMHPQKAHDDLLRAFERVRERQPTALLLLAGDGDLRDEIRATIRALRMVDAVRVLGARTDVRDLYHLADVNVLPSLKEGFSNVVLEAMAAGVPQVLTDVGGAREAIGESNAALIVPPRDPIALAEAICRIVDEPERARAMAAAAVERAAQFTVEDQVRRTEELYLDLAGRKGLLE